MTTPSHRILLFLPMYNCERQIPRVVAQLTPDIASLFDEMIIVDNRSTDTSQAAAVRALRERPYLRARVLLNTANYGLGGSHKVAFTYALDHGFTHCVVFHGDDQGSIADLAPLIGSRMHQRFDCLLGARFMPGARLEGYSFVRTLGNRIFNLIYSLASGVRIYDLGSGLNLYSVSALADCAYLRHANDLTFNYHMILHSIAAKWRIHFFPISWREQDQISNVKLVRQSLRVLGIAVAYAFRYRRYLREDHSGSSASYAATVIFDSSSPKEATS